MEGDGLQGFFNALQVLRESDAPGCLPSLPGYPNTRMSGHKKTSELCTTRCHDEFGNELDHLVGVEKINGLPYVTTREFFASDTLADGRQRRKTVISYPRMPGLTTHKLNNGSHVTQWVEWQRGKYYCASVEPNVDLSDVAPIVNATTTYEGITWLDRLDGSESVASLQYKTTYYGGIIDRSLYTAVHDNSIPYEVLQRSFDSNLQKYKIDRVERYYDMKMGSEVATDNWESHFAMPTATECRSFKEYHYPPVPGSVAIGQGLAEPNPDWGTRLPATNANTSVAIPSARTGCLEPGHQGYSFAFPAEPSAIFDLIHDNNGDPICGFQGTLANIPVIGVDLRYFAQWVDQCNNYPSKFMVKLAGRPFADFPFITADGEVSICMSEDESAGGGKADMDLSCQGALKAVTPEYADTVCKVAGIPGSIWDFITLKGLHLNDDFKLFHAELEVEYHHGIMVENQLSNAISYKSASTMNIPSVFEATGMLGLVHSWPIASGAAGGSSTFLALEISGDLHYGFSDDTHKEFEFHILSGILPNTPTTRLLNIDMKKIHP